MYVKADFVTSTLMCGFPMGTPSVFNSKNWVEWLLVSEDASIFCAQKKSVNNKYICDK